MLADLAERIAEAGRTEDVEIQEHESTANPLTDSLLAAAPEPQPEPEPAPEGGRKEHTAGTLQALPADGRASSAASAFASMRFDGQIPPAAEELQRAMAERGASLEIVNMCASLPLSLAVASA